jgi:hypothetical protein
MPRSSHHKHRHHYKTQMAGGFDPEKYRRRHLYGHEQKKGVDAPVEVVEEPKSPETKEASIETGDAPKADVKY